MMMGSLNGKEVIVDDNLVIYKGFDIVKRSLWSMLTQKPLFKRYRSVPKIVPSTQIIEYKDKLIMHSTLYDELKKHYILTEDKQQHFKFD